ncbi:hypothetical protein PPERSA_06609 [Pseudocohnilembus persalinus]|uniref:Uncharacterized protein n=1 Tax=Pseudocohnilembus persalinus TaxID=266149 RepID=A0A0V0QRP8_PSEPJ|nr:hypothetical protein PPERSA_06609 [Pseudocohnilembus persalinus]|eukprot:KRX04975.1 hypothetical protein PPERSA_06609 [Pseudocohnilembus persalinus]
MQTDSYSTFDNNINLNNLQSQLINKKLQKETSILSNQEKNSQQNDKFQQQTKSLNVFQMSENSGNSKTFTQNVIVSNCNLQNTLQNCNQNSSNFHAFNSNKYSIQQDIRFSHDQLLMNKSTNNINNICNNSNNQRQQDIHSFRNLYQNQNNLGLNTKNEIITEKEESDRNICEEEDIIKNEQYNFNNDTNNKNFKTIFNKKYTDQKKCNDLNLNDDKFRTLQCIQQNVNDQNNIKSEKYLKLQKQAEYIRYQMQKQQITHAKEQFDELTKYQLKEQFFKERKNYLISQGFYEFDPDAIPVPKLQKVKNSSILTRRIFVFYKNEIMQNPKIFVQNKFQKF